MVSEIFLEFCKEDASIENPIKTILNGEYDVTHTLKHYCGTLERVPPEIRTFGVQMMLAEAVNWYYGYGTLQGKMPTKELERGLARVVKSLKTLAELKDATNKNIFCVADEVCLSYILLCEQLKTISQDSNCSSPPD